jgi:hypothetical protein
MQIPAGDAKLEELGAKIGNMWNQAQDKMQAGTVAGLKEFEGIVMNVLGEIAPDGGEKDSFMQEALKKLAENF